LKNSVFNDGIISKNIGVILYKQRNNSEIHGWKFRFTLLEIPRYTTAANPRYMFRDTNRKSAVQITEHFVTEYSVIYN
jgi:hypothetical protein